MRSMTAFARQQIQAETGTLSWELRSVNHRYLELNFRLPEAMRHMETQLRAEAQSYLQRGKIDLTLRYQPLAEQAIRAVVNQPLVHALMQSYQQIATLTDSPVMPLDIGQLLAWPTVVQIEETVPNEIQTAILQLFKNVITELVTERSREGKILQSLIKQRFIQINQELETIKKSFPVILLRQREQLLQRFAELSAVLDPQRLEQEIVLYAQKMDIAEEIERAETHIKEALRVINQQGAIGRRLDFLLQELHREINTIGSKLSQFEVTKSVVEIKVLLEQIREQAQNIE